MHNMGFPKVRGSLLGVSYKKDSSVLGSMLGPLYFGKLPYVEASEGVSCPHMFLPNCV